ncbi:hypothetical protein ElyMa_000687600 [Elysia marginata]|uniref:Uncharacterized protein n=1 Tax=Elysia marginata TaxID=1093978 RepID=A0AAV4GIH6_9GAST|nr:hypothetical protein ElyMa_000687600 [Elysia marginata]
MINCKIITYSEKKAIKFVQQYRDVADIRNSKVRLPRAECEARGIQPNRDKYLLRKVHQATKTKRGCEANRICSNITRYDAALSQLKNTSSGDDDAHNTMLQDLPLAGTVQISSSRCSTESTHQASNLQLGKKAPSYPS